MDQIRLLVKTYIRTKSYRETARITGMSKNTTKNYLKRLQSHSNDFQVLLDMDDEAMAQCARNTNSPSTLSSRAELFDAQVTDWLSELKKKGVTRKLLWEEYKEKHGDTCYCLSQFCDRLQGHIQARQLTMSLSHTPGEQMQLDFAGKPLEWVERGTGEIHRCQVLVAVMPFSQYTFAIALASQKVEDFVYGITKAFDFFGVRPNSILCDNLKSYVIKTDRYEPTFNQLTEQLAGHYEVELQATRVARPKDKASVEGAVKICYQRIHAKVRNEVFHSIEELNESVSYYLELHNSLPYQKKAGTRKLNYETYEKPVMRPLPTTHFEHKHLTKAKVQLNYHVYLGEDKTYYSVPYRYVQQQALLVYTRTIVEIMIKGVRVAAHPRLTLSARGKYQTAEKHLPKNHKEWKDSKGYNAEHFINKAKLIGPHTSWLVHHIMQKQFHQSQAFKSCQGILMLTKTYTDKRVEKAAKRCHDRNTGSYHSMKSILVKNLDKDALVRDIIMPDHENIRGNYT